MSQDIEISRLSLTAEHSPATRFGIAVVAVGLTLGLRVALSHFVPNDSVFLFFLPPVLISAGIGGLWPGLLATVLSIGAAVLFVFIDPMSHSKLFLANGIAFTIIAIGVSWGGGMLHRNRQRADVMTRDAMAREAHLQSILDTVPEAMIVIDERGIIQSFSSAAERLFGQPAADTIGHNIK